MSDRFKLFFNYYFYINRIEIELKFSESINKYDSSASSTYKAITDNPAFKIGYETGGVSGTRATETVSVI